MSDPRTTKLEFSRWVALVENRLARRGSDAQEEERPLRVAARSGYLHDEDAGRWTWTDPVGDGRCRWRRRHAAGRRCMRTALRARRSADACGNSLTETRFVRSTFRHRERFPSESNPMEDQVIHNVLSFHPFPLARARRSHPECRARTTCHPPALYPSSWRLSGPADPDVDRAARPVDTVQRRSPPRRVVSRVMPRDVVSPRRDRPRCRGSCDRYLAGPLRSSQAPIQRVGH